MLELLMNGVFVVQRMNVVCVNVVALAQCRYTNRMCVCVHSAFSFTCQVRYIKGRNVSPMLYSQNYIFIFFTVL
jgi:hypothetical protein